MRRRIAELTILAASALVSIAAAEAALRASGRASALWSHFAPHAELGWTFLPARDGGRGHLGSNRLGFRDVEHEVAKPGGTRRLLVLGDSFTAATQVRLERSYPRVLQGLLDERSAEPWEVISLAVNGWGTVQEWLALERYGLAYEPDAVLLQFFPNDVCNNALSASDLCAFHDEMRPYLVGHGETWRVTWKEPLRRQLRLSSALYRVFERGLDEVRLRWRSGSLGGVAEADEMRLARGEQAERLQARFGVGMHPFFYAYAPESEQIPQVAEGWRLTERVIEHMASSLRAAGIRFGVVVMPYEGAVDPDAWDAFWSREPRPPVSLGRDYPERRLDALASRLGVPICLLLDRFEQNRASVLPYRKYHLNVSGHRVAAEGIYDLLLSEGIVRERPAHST